MIPSIRTLLKVAGFGGFITAGTGLAFKSKFERRLRDTKIYQEALQIVYSEEKVVKHLGEPISEGKLKFGTNTDDIKNFSVLLIGSNTSGILDCDIRVFSEPDIAPEIKNLQIKFNDIPEKAFIIKNN